MVRGFGRQNAERVELGGNGGGSIVKRWSTLVLVAELGQNAQLQSQSDHLTIVSPSAGNSKAGAGHRQKAVSERRTHSPLSSGTCGTEKRPRRSRGVAGLSPWAVWKRPERAGMIERDALARSARTMGGPALLPLERGMLATRDVGVC
jgi:hypothetical protein